MKKIFCTFVTMLSIVMSTIAQDAATDDSGVEGSIGLGYGLEYGGAGVRLSGPIAKNIELFGGVGYNFRDIGLNGGISYQPITKGVIRPVVVAMYGYNGVVTQNNIHPRFTRTYYGLSVGGGVNYYLGRNDNYINLKFIYALKSDEYKQALDEDSSLKEIPVMISAGFHIAIGY